MRGVFDLAKRDEHGLAMPALDASTMRQAAVISLGRSIHRPSRPGQIARQAYSQLLPPIILHEHPLWKQSTARMFSRLYHQLNSLTLTRGQSSESALEFP